MHGNSFAMAFMFLSYALLSTSKGQCLKEPRCRRSESLMDRALQGNVLREVKVSGYPACHAECEEDKRCISLNFDLSTLVCQLNHQTATNSSSRLAVKKHGSIYAERIDRHPGRPLVFSKYSLPLIIFLSLDFCVFLNNIQVLFREKIRDKQ